MARLRKAKIKKSKAGPAFVNWDTDYLSNAKAKRTSKPSAKSVKKFEQ